MLMLHDQFTNSNQIIFSLCLKKRKHLLRSSAMSAEHVKFQQMPSLHKTAAKGEMSTSA